MLDQKVEHAIFESEVRRVAGELFPRARTNGPVILDGRERDGIYNDGEVIHIIEATVSKKKDKVEGDLRKSVDLLKELRRTYTEVNFKIWVITSVDPTADQQGLVPNFRKQARCPVEVCSYRAFSSKLVDAAKYLQLRDNYPFGSVRNPADDADAQVPSEEYVYLDLLDADKKVTISARDLTGELAKYPKTYLLLGDYGAGKSMTSRHLYYALKARYLSGSTTKFPLYLNLRDHFGQHDPAEALIRHANAIGMPLPGQLVAGWRAGHMHVFLDGFDELSSTRMVRGVGGLRQARRQAMRLVHAFVEGHPRATTLFISGREHYFDSADEMKTALGVPDSSTIFTLNEFTQEQMEDYLTRKGFNQSVPDWLPSRPLLVGYLAMKGILSGTPNDLSNLPPQQGWNYLLDRVCEREARQIDPITIEPAAVREFVERLATIARQYDSGRGPIYLHNIHSIFEEVFAFPPDEKAETMIFRMPGFTAASGQADAREFIDNDYVDACRAGDVCRFILAPHDDRFSILDRAAVEMKYLGCSIAAMRLADATSKQLSAALLKASDREAACLAMDVLCVMQQVGVDYIGTPAYIKNGFFESVEVTARPNFSEVHVQECYFGSVVLDAGTLTGPKFESCEIAKLYGALTADDLPKVVFKEGNAISEYPNDAATNADILDLPLPLGVKVLMTILRKLFFQAGRGRKENAFFRGLDERAQAYVPDVLGLVEQFDFAKPYRVNGPKVWIPDRAQARQAREILQAPQQSNHPLVRKVRQLGGP